MRDQVSYEWAIECEDEHGDIQNVSHADTYAEALAAQASYATHRAFLTEPAYAAVSIALTRTEGNDMDGINWRGYAYLVDGTLEARFSSFHDNGPANDGPDVPQRFFAEVAKAS
jgi:hypothetical protein